LELFISDLTTSAANIASKNGDSKVTPGHVRAVIDGKGAQPYLGFLKEAVSKVPELKVSTNPHSAGGLYESADLELAAQAQEANNSGTRRKAKLSHKLR
jgi:hypothetical protein